MKVGDLIIFHEEKVDVAGLIVARTDVGDDNDAVLVKYADSPGLDPLHFYEYELEEWVKDGSIKIQYAT